MLQYQNNNSGRAGHQVYADLAASFSPVRFAVVIDAPSPAPVILRRTGVLITRRAIRPMIYWVESSVAVCGATDSPGLLICSARVSRMRPGNFDPM